MFTKVVPASVVILLTSLVFQSISALRLEIQPVVYKEETSGGVQMSCFLEDTDLGKETDFLMQIERSGHQPMVFIRKGFDVTYSYESDRTKIHAEGNISDVYSNTYLQLTLLTPTKNDTGDYTCRMFFTGTTGLMEENKAFARLEVKGSTTEDNLMTLEEDLKTLKKRVEQIDAKYQSEVSLLEEVTRNQTSYINRMAFQAAVDRVADEVVVLEDKTRKQSTQIDYLTDQVDYTVAFSASKESADQVAHQKIIVFDHVIFREGQGYDEKTGIFTAPRAGIYVLHLVVAQMCKNCKSGVFMMNNRAVLTSIHMGAADYRDQSASSVVQQLAAGDKVRCFNWNLFGKSTYTKAGFTIFSGYLIKPL